MYPKSTLKTREERITEARSRGPKTQFVKIQEAEDRNSKWSKKTPQEQLNYLDKLLGKNNGAKKQRAKIGAKLG